MMPHEPIELRVASGYFNTQAASSERDRRQTTLDSRSVAGHIGPQKGSWDVNPRALGRRYS